MTLSLLGRCKWSRDVGFTEAVTNGQELGNEIMRLVQMPLPFLDVNCGEEVLALLFEAMLGGKGVHKNTGFRALQ